MPFFSKKRRRRPELATQVVEIVSRLRAEHGLTDPVDLDAPLGPEGLGFDSMGRMDLLAAVENECGVRVPHAFWGSRPLRSLNHLLDVCR